jgi:hypothetical protein
VLEKALEITKGLNTDKEKAVALFYWVRDKIKYIMTSFYMIKSNFLFQPLSFYNNLFPHH